MAEQATLSANSPEVLVQVQNFLASVFSASAVLAANALGDCRYTVADCPSRCMACPNPDDAYALMHCLQPLAVAAKSTLTAICTPDL